MQSNHLNDLLLRKLHLKKELLKIKAREHLLPFINYIKEDYQTNWHHELIINEVDDFINDRTPYKRLMILAPPQHGKSEISTRQSTCYTLGRYPNTRLALLCYNVGLARKFSREIVRYMETDEYRGLFPETIIPGMKGVKRGSYIRTSEEFEIIDKEGTYKAVGVQGGLSGHPVDFAIIDDPIKDRLEANSKTYRDRVWEWYTDVLVARLHNDSKVLLTVTKWHEDDLAGRLLEVEGDMWHVIKLQAIKTQHTEPGDPRAIGEPLWEERHDLNKLQKAKRINPKSFESLYQQNPTAEEGNIIKRDWFIIQDHAPEYLTWDMWIDGAYTKSTKNDPTGIIITAYKDKKLYVKMFYEKYMEMPELLKEIEKIEQIHELTPQSKCLIEPKASGTTLKQLINVSDRINIAAVEIKSKLVSQGKEARIQTSAPRVEAGQIILIKHKSNEAFIHQNAAYPSTHDEAVDLLGYAVDYYFPKKKKKNRINIR